MRDVYHVWRWGVGRNKYRTVKIRLRSRGLGYRILLKWNFKL